MTPQLLFNQAVSLHQQGRLADAEPLYLQLLAAAPDVFQGHYLFAILRFQQQRSAEALRALETALKINPDAPEALNLHGVLLQAGGRREEALASFTRAFALKPDFAEASYNKGIALAELKRHAEAVLAFDQALALAPNAEVFNSRGSTLRTLKRFGPALESFDAALALAPDHVEALTNRASLLLRLARFDEAAPDLGRALALRPDDPGALAMHGRLLCETGRVAEGFAVLRRHAELVHGADPGTRDGDPEHKRTHDAEQRAHLAAQGVTPGFHLGDGARLAGAAISPANAQDIDAQWLSNKPQLVVIDNLLTPQALEKLQRYCRDSTIWRDAYKNGYLGAMPEYGLAAPLLAQIADELRQTFPAVFGDHQLQLLWGFKYDGSLGGVGIHADQAAVNVNIWITPDEANTNPDNGGLIVWDASAPLDWEFSQYNGCNDDAVRDFLAKAGAKATVVPYRANRAVIFDSDLFHETDNIEFRPGYENRRIGITLLYGRRSASGN